MISIYAYMEDFDNAELSDYERDEQLMEAVREYNTTYSSDFKPEHTLRNYKSIKREQYYE
jgi:hypothetical protein